MPSEKLRGDLIASLEDIYRLEAFGALADLLQGEALTLRYLFFHQGQDVYPSDLSRELWLSRSRITGTLNSLRRKKLITIRRSLTDRRRVQVSITEDGAALFQEKQAQMESYFDQMIQGLGPSDTQALINLIHRCVEVMKP